MPVWRLVLLVVAAPVALAVAGLFHPDDLTVDTARQWTALHVVLLPLFPLLGGALVLLLRGLGGVVPAVARLAAYSYAVFYTGLDAVAGVAAGRVAQTAQAAAGGAGQTAEGLEPVVDSNPKTATAYVQEELKRWTPMIDTLGLKQK